MNDSTFDRVVTAAGIVLGLYWYLRGRQGAPFAPPQLPSYPTDPNLVAYRALYANRPPIGTAQQLTVNVNGGAAQFLSSQYQALFGFVGMANGAMY